MGFYFFSGAMSFPNSRELSSYFIDSQVFLTNQEADDCVGPSEPWFSLDSTGARQRPGQMGVHDGLEQTVDFWNSEIPKKGC